MSASQKNPKEVEKSLSQGGNCMYTCGTIHAVCKRRCTACKGEDCNECSNCKDMKKYGGPGTKKQCCIKRRCLRK